MYCVSFDPGETTGVILVPSIQEPWYATACQLGPDEHHSRLLRLLTLWSPEVIICEDFENRGNAAAVLASVQYIGVVKAYCQATNTTVVFQGASIGKTFWTDSKLKAYDLWIVGLKHARDALRHYLYYRTFTMSDQSLLRRTSTGIVRRMTNQDLGLGSTA